MKIKRIAAALAAAAVLTASAVSLTACGGGGPATLEGTTWNVEKMTSDGMDMTPMLESLGGMTCEFKDGELVMTAMGQTSTVKYTYEEGNLVVEGDTGSISGDTITFNISGDTLVLKKQAPEQK